MNRLMRSVLTLSALGLLACPISSAVADPLEDFYRGKQIRIIIRAEPGGNYDIYSRILVRHMMNYIPGKPIAIPVNMPGGSGLTALNYLAEIAPKDGTVLTIVTQTFPAEQALALNKNLKVDVRALNWIGNMSASNSFILTSERSETRTIEDAKLHETRIGGSSGADVIEWIIAALNTTWGTKFKVIAGYPSGPAITLAMARGEVDGRGTTNPRTVLAGTDSDVASVHLLLQSGLHKDKDYPNVPLLNDLAADEHQRVVFEYFSEMGALARPIAMAAGVPADRVAMMRAAFEKTMQDPKFLAEAQQQSLEITMMSGAEVAQIVHDLVDVPPSVIASIRRAIEM